MFVSVIVTEHTDDFSTNYTQENDIEVELNGEKHRIR